MMKNAHYVTFGDGVVHVALSGRDRTLCMASLVNRPFLKTFSFAVAEGSLDYSGVACDICAALRTNL